MRACAWDLYACFLAVVPVCPRERKPQAWWIGWRATHMQFVIMGEELRACSETLTLATSQLLPWRKASSCLSGLNMQQACCRPASVMLMLIGQLLFGKAQYFYTP